MGTFMEELMERFGGKTETGLKCKNCSKEYEGCEESVQSSLLNHIAKAECLEVTPACRKFLQDPNCYDDYRKIHFDDAPDALEDLNPQRSGGYALRSRTRIQKKTKDLIRKQNQERARLHALYCAGPRPLTPEYYAANEKLEDVAKSIPKFNVLDLMKRYDAFFNKYPPPPPPPPIA